MKACVVIPCYNEEFAIGEIVLKAKRYVDEVIVADDGSTDGTALLSQRLGARVVRSERRLGFGKNVMMGINSTNADVVITLDGDGQHNPDEIPKVLELIEKGEADLAIGSRFINHYKAPFYRKVGIDIITWLYNVGHKKKITDGQSCFRAYTRKLLDSIMIEEGGFGFSTEILIKARLLGFRIVEVPVSCIYHKELYLNSTMSPILQGITVALSTVLWRLRTRK